MEPFNRRRISDVSFIIDKDLNAKEGNRSFMRLFNVTDPKICIANFMSDADSDTFRRFLTNFPSQYVDEADGNPYFIARLEFKGRGSLVFDTKRNSTEITSKNCLFHVENAENGLFRVDVKELSYSRQLLDKALLQSREYNALLQNFDANYFVYNGKTIILKNTQDTTYIFEGRPDKFWNFFAEYFKIDKTNSDSEKQFYALIDDTKRFVSNKIYKMLQTDSNLITVHTVKTSTRSKRSLVGSITLGDERTPMHNAYAETKDGLTDLYNKKAITELAIQKINERKTPTTLIIMDVDKFKECNDTFGHAFGDKVLSAVASCIKDSIRNVGIAGRIGGDEFLILLDKTDESDIRNIARNIRIGIQWSITAAEPSSIVTCSMGIARFPTNAKNYDELFNIADKCLYIAKDKGRNCYIIYKPELHDEIIVNRKKNENAISSGEFLKSAAKSEREIIRALSGEGKIDTAIEMLRSYMGVNKITVYDEHFSVTHECETLTQESQEKHGDIRAERLKEPKEYFKFFNKFGFLHLDNTNTFETLDKKTFDMYRGASISSTLEVKSEKSLICMDLYHPARTFPKEKIIFALLASSLICERIEKPGSAC